MPTDVKPIVTPMPAPSAEALAAAEAAGPGSEEQKAIDAAAAAAKPELDDKGQPIVKEIKEPAAEPKKEPDADPSLSFEKKEEIVVTETGFDEFDTVGKMLAEKGVATANEIMEDFLKEGEISLAHKAVMIEALGEGVANMAFKQMESTASSIIAEAKADSQKSMEYANKKFGGEDPKLTWQQMSDYVRTPEAGFSDADLAAMNTMLEAGGLQAQLVIDKVHSVYTADKNTSLPGTLLEGDAGTDGNTFEPISRIDYTAEMGKAVGKYGEDSPQVRALNRRRTLSMNAGY